MKDEGFLHSKGNQEVGKITKMSTALYKEQVSVANFPIQNNETEVIHVQGDSITGH